LILRRNRYFVSDTKSSRVQLVVSLKEISTPSQYQEKSSPGKCFYKKNSKISYLFDTQMITSLITICNNYVYAIEKIDAY